MITKILVLFAGVFVWTCAVYGVCAFVKRRREKKIIEEGEQNE